MTGTQNGYTALMTAASNGHAAAVTALLNAGADVEATSDVGRVAVHDSRGDASGAGDKGGTRVR